MDVSSNKFKALFNSALDAVIVFKKGGVIIDANDSAADLFSIPRASLVSMNISALLPKIPRGRRGELKLSSPLHNVTMLEYTQTKDFIPNTSVIFLRDISDRIIEKKNREHFLDIAGHEIKTPLASIKAYVQILQKTVDEETKIYLAKIDEKTNMVTQLINELLDVTRIRQDQMSFMYEVCNFDALVDEVRNEFSFTYPTHAIVTSGLTNKSIVADKGRIIQVVSNIIKNAIRYSPNRNKIFIDLESDRKSVTMKVADEGIGILPENLDKVFDLYFRSPKGKNTAPGGLGVGLYISSQIVKKHGGTLTVTSETNKGTTFTITLPLLPKKGKARKKNYSRIV